MGFFSKLFGSSKNNDQNANAQALHTSITRALAGVVYYDSTMGEEVRDFLRLMGIEQPEHRENNIIAALLQALLKNGTVTGKEMLSDLVEPKVQRFRKRDLIVNDLIPCILCFFYFAIEDAKRFHADQEIINLLVTALNIFWELIEGAGLDNPDLTAAKNSSRYREIADYVDTGEDEVAAPVSSPSLTEEAIKLQVAINNMRNEGGDISRITEIIPASISNSNQQLAAEAFSACIQCEDRLLSSSLLNRMFGENPEAPSFDEGPVRNIAKQLLLAGLSPNIYQNDEPLIYAAIARNPSPSAYYTKLLIEHGAILDVTNKDGYSPLGAYLKRHFPDGSYHFEPFIKHGGRLNDKDLSDFDVYKPIFQGGLYDIAKTIPENKLKPLAKKGTGKTEITLLHLAAGGPQINASPELQTMFKTRYLENDGYPSVIELLLDCGADPLQRTSTGYSAVNIALKYGHNQVFLILSKRFRDNLTCFSRIIDEPFRGKGTALFNACLRGDTEEVKFLLELGANPNARSFVNYPENDLFEPDVPQEVGARLFQDSISSHINPNFFHHMEYGVTNLHYPATNNDSEIVRMLLEAGADPNAICYNGLFPLYVAAETGNLDVIKVLISHGAEVNKTTPKGCTPILNAAEEGELETVQYLLDNGADPYIRNRAGQTAIDAAIEKGQTQAAQIMKSYR